MLDGPQADAVVYLDEDVDEPQVLGARCSVLGARCSVLGARCSVLGARCSVLGARCSVLGADLSTFVERLTATGLSIEALIA